MREVRLSLLIALLLTCGLVGGVLATRPAGRAPPVPAIELRGQERAPARADRHDAQRERPRVRQTRRNDGARARPSRGAVVVPTPSPAPVGDRDEDGDDEDEDDADEDDSDGDD